MAGLGEQFPEYQNGGGQVSPKDIDRYEVYTIIGPMIGTFQWGTVTGTSTQTKTVVWDQVLPDYPRNVEMSLVAASGSTTGGTFTLYGKDQFGNVISEDFAVAVAANGGTAVGTKVFAYFGTASGTMGTCNAGAGTVIFYPASTGTTALFGLPAKIGSTLDVKLMTFGSTGVAKPVNGGTIGGFVSTAMHAIKAPNTLTTPAADLTWIQVWYKPTYDGLFKKNSAAL